MEAQAKNDHLTTNHRVRDIVNHPAFQGFGELMLPWADNAEYLDTRLERVGSLMPYHSHVDADVVVGALNHLIDEVDAGKTIFYDFYTERQKQEDPTKKLTGLFFCRGKTGAAVRHRLSGRRVLLRRLAPRGLPARPGDQQEGAQRVRDQVSRG